MKHRPHVALIIETSIVYGRQLLKGITEYLRAHPPWSIFVEQRELSALPPQWLDTWQGDGIICRFTTPELAQRWVDSGIHVVDLDDVQAPFPGLPRIWSDDRAIGRLAAEHLLERGFHHFAYCGFTIHEWAARRRQGFATHLEHQGRSCAIYESPWGGPQAQAWEEEQQQIARWLQSLPKPLGVLACNDMRGQHVLDACLRAQLAVPEEVAVVGVDNDELLCELCNPPLSSIRTGAEQVGYEAAALLDRLMAGGRPTQAELEIPPIGVATRLSSDVLAIDDPDIALAVQHIRRHACEGLSVEDVLREVPLSRSVLERRFRKFLDRSPQEFIREIQLKRVKQLLVETDLPLDRIADLAGYKHAEYMSVVFRRELGQTPGNYRKEHSGS